MGVNTKKSTAAESAFPILLPLHEMKGERIHLGINKLEYYTAFALMGLVANPKTRDPATIAHEAVEIANATIEALKKRQKYQDRDT